jgi:hypothetical protein
MKPPYMRKFNYKNIIAKKFEDSNVAKKRGRK